MSNEVLRNFCNHHQIKILDTNKRAHSYHKLNINYFRDPADFNMVHDTIVSESVPLYTVEVTESELIKMAEFESQVFNNMKQHGHYDLFHMLMEQKEHEKFLKEKYPAVKKAYEHYSLMLKLAESGEL